MDLEVENKGVISNPDTNAVENAIDSLNDDNSFAILGSDDDYIQTAVAGSGFLAEYRDAGGHFRSSDEELPAAAIKELFVMFLEKDPSWRSRITWVKGDDYKAESGSGSSSAGGSGTGSGNIADDLVEQIKKKGMSWIKKKLNKFL